MEFIAQFTSSIIGTRNYVLTDVFLDNNRLILFRKNSNSTFELGVVERDSYNKKEFDNFLELGRLKSSDCNLLHLWRANKVLHPTLMSDRYYEDIIQLHKAQELKEKSNFKFIQELLKKATDEINSYL